MTPKMPVFEAIYGRISTRNAQRRAATLTSHHMLYSTSGYRSDGVAFLLAQVVCTEIAYVTRLVIK